MSIESEADSGVDSTEADVDTLARELGETITELPVYQRFLDAKAEIEDDEEIQEEIREFERLREEFMLARQTGEATQSDLRELQQAQEQLHDYPAMSEYLEVQSELELKLQELNELVSEPLTIDFGEKAGGCCQD